MSQQSLEHIKRLIKKKATEIGIDKIGFASAEPFDYIEESFYQQKKAGHTTGFEHKVIEERIYPELIFDQPQSIISICLAYPSQIRNPLPSEREQRRGQFARASWGIDYHDILRDKMNQLMTYVEEIVPEIRFKTMVDTGELSDVLVAERAGIGFIGRNGLLITKEYGSYVYLGEIITNLPFPVDERVPFGCGDCYRCVQACPTQALLGDGRMNGPRCLSYQTQTKQLMPHEFRRKITHVIYGCDICQLTCPFNQGIDFHLHPEMEPVPEQVQPELKSMLNLSNREFKETYGHLSGAWRGKKPLQRNAIIALANYQDQSAIPHLLEVMEKDPRSVIRATAAYAVSQIQKYQNPSLIAFIEEQMSKETEQDIIDEMAEAIKKLKNKRRRRHTS